MKTKWIALALSVPFIIAVFSLFLWQIGIDRTRDLFEGMFYLVGVIAAILSYFQYRENSQQEKAHWLFDLYQRFYSDEKMRKVREELDWDRFEFLRDPSYAKNGGQLAELDNYLNFFEFMAYLIKLGRISKKDSGELFGYFLENLKKKPVLDYISKYGYRKLYNLLTVRDPDEAGTNA